MTVLVAPNFGSWYAAEEEVPQPDVGDEPAARAEAADVLVSCLLRRRGPASAHFRVLAFPGLATGVFVLPVELIAVVTGHVT